MSNNVTLPGAGAVVETLDVGGGIERQVVTIAPRDLSGADSIGSLTETAPATDTASSGLNGRLQRIAQRITSLIALLPVALGAGGGLKVDGSGTALPISAGALPLPAGAAADATVAALVTAADFDAKVGALTETAPATDTASSGLNGRLQRIAQRITSLLALLPVALGAGGGLKIDGSGTSLPVTATVAPSTTDVAVVPTVTAGAYTAGFGLGGIMTFANLLAATSFNGILHSITAKFKGAAVTGNLQVAIFKANPASGTYTDHVAPTWNAADMANLVGIYTLPTPLSKLGAMTIYNLDGIGKALVGASQSLFAVVIVDGTPTPASTSDFTLELSVLPG
jgi:hypothetical protein